MAQGIDYLGPILERKRRENTRRRKHGARGARIDVGSVELELDRGAVAVAALRRASAGAPRVIAEIKHRSPSAGLIRARVPGAVQAIAQQYAEAGAAAISVLCDGPGFGGSVLDVRRAEQAVSVPLLFKEFVLDPLQVSLARAVGAHMVLLLVRALDAASLQALVDEVRRQGMAPVVEAADENELEVALATGASIVGVNARDLRSFRVDTEGARRALSRVPAERIAVHMSGVRSAEDLLRVGESRADAVLVGEALMRAASPGARLQQWLASI
jgi:indole-3-glycerol phosphate synthase